MATDTRELPALPKLEARDEFPRNVTTAPVQHKKDNVQRQQRQKQKPYVALLPEQEYIKAKALAITVQSKDALLHKMKLEKEVLHQQSLNRVKTWTNTILGQRAKRLASLAEKEKMAETERERIDNDWHLLHSAEVTERVEKARFMQYKTTPSMRNLRDKLNLSNVLFERKMQIEHKKKLEELLQTYAYDEKEALRRDKEAEIREIVKNELDLRSRIKTAADQQKQAKERFLNALKEREEEKETETKICQQIAKEDALEKEKSKAQRLNDAKKMHVELQKIINDRKEFHEKIKESDQDRQWVNENFLKMQEKVAAKKKNFQDQKSQTKENILEKVSAINNKLNGERDNDLDEFRHKMEIAHMHDFEIKEAEKLSKRLARVAEIDSYRLFMIREREQRENKEKIESRQELEREEAAKREFDQQIFQEKIDRRVKLAELKKFHLVQM
ncbi:hypothetical protein HK100_001301, partial [Physocladia obscura]